MGSKKQLSEDAVNNRNNQTWDDFVDSVMFSVEEKKIEEEQEAAQKAQDAEAEQRAQDARIEAMYGNIFCFRCGCFDEALHNTMCELCYKDEESLMAHAEKQEIDSAWAQVSGTKIVLDPEDIPWV
jgi:hypothetical protein